VVIYVRFVHPLFNTVALKPQEWLIAIMPGVTMFLVETLRKIFVQKLFSIGKWEPFKIRLSFFIQQ